MNWFILKLLIVSIFIVNCSSQKESVTKKISDDYLPIPQIEFNPKSYVCYRIESPLTIDGNLDEKEWEQAKWTDEFVDIEGDLKPKPIYSTKVKMLYDSEYFYFGAEMEEPHVWAKLKKRDAVIYHDNDFEIFIDPNGDTHEYYELEVNAYGTEWDLLLTRPYRDNGTAINAWDIQGLKTGINIKGTLNNPNDIDSGWSVEIAIPWEVLSQCAHKPTPPNDKDQWRVNFSRVQWQTQIIDGEYVKKKDETTGKNLSEDNWVWSPQGIIAMHYPEMFGFVQFSANQVGTDEVPFIFNPVERTKLALRKIYYAQRTYKMQYGIFTDNLNQLAISDADISQFLSISEITASENQFEAKIEYNSDTIITIDHEGRTIIRY